MQRNVEIKMFESLKGRTALITGAAQGIGRAAALALTKEGVHVWATDINESLLEQIPALHPNIRARQLDVTSQPDIEA